MNFYKLVYIFITMKCISTILKKDKIVLYK